MKRILLFLLAGFLLVSSSLVSLPGSARADLPRQNYCPIVLVGGALAWGRGEVLGIPVFGGNMCDIQSVFRHMGYMTYTAGVGPYSSTWDRACELYAQVKGGTVDYGYWHAMKYGHARFGRTYPGLYPDWDKDHKVHMIGHCFGGMTIRCVITLLEKGAPEELQPYPAGEPPVSDLFTGGKSWVLGAISVAGPHDGTSGLYLPVVRQACRLDLVKFLFLMAGPGLDIDTLIDYDVMLDQWGFPSLQKGESVRKLMVRLLNSGLLNSQDFCNNDMDAWAICRFNAWATASPNTYYFSQSCNPTWKDKKGCCHPLTSVIPTNWIVVEALGRYKNTKSFPFPIDETWFPNDGTCNTKSEKGPHVYLPDYTGPKDIIEEYPATNYYADIIPKRGQWNTFSELKVDHLDVIGANFGWFINNPLDWWRDYARILGSLPPT
jgi:triacylglycerol lipase